MVKTCLPLLGSAWASKNQAKIDTAGGRYKAFLTDIDWEEIFKLLYHVKSNYTAMLKRYSQTPIGEAEREQARWKNKDLFFPATFGSDVPKGGRRRRHQPVTPSKKKEAGEGITSAKSKKAWASATSTPGESLSISRLARRPKAIEDDDDTATKEANDISSGGEGLWEE